MQVHAFIRQAPSLCSSLKGLQRQKLFYSEGTNQGEIEGERDYLYANPKGDILSFKPGDYENEPIIDQEGRQWRSPEDLGRLRRDGLKMPRNSHVAIYDESKGDALEVEPYIYTPEPYEATMKQHSMMLRDMDKGNSKNEKKGRFVSDEERWLHKYDALVRFYERYGHTFVPQLNPEMLNSVSIKDKDEMLITNEGFDYYQNAGNFTEESLTLYVNDEFMEPYSKMQLGYWVMQQRYHYHYYNGTRMTLQRVEYLNALNFVWDIDAARWQEQYQQLKEFKKKFGHTLVRQNTTLGHWIYKQRWHDRSITSGKTVYLGDIPDFAFNESNKFSDQTMSEDTIIRNGRGQYYNGKPISPLTPSRRALLNDVGFIWEHWDHVWESSFAELVEFKTKYGHTRVSPKKYPSLGRWVRKHRAKWREMQEVLDCNNNIDAIENVDKSSLLWRDRFEKLESIGFEWVVRKYTWDDNYHCLLDYKSIYGHVNVPHSYVDPDKQLNLGHWLNSQRSSRRIDRKLRREAQNQGTTQPKAKMPKERITKLEKSGIIWEPALVKFEQHAKDSLEYQLTGKKMSTPIMKWYQSMKKECKKYFADEPSRLDEDRIQILRDFKLIEE